MNPTEEGDTIPQLILRDAVFKACNTLDAFESMPLSSIREEAERLLDLPKKALKTRKDEIMDIVFQFRNVHKPHQRKKTLVQVSNDVVKKKGKFSVHETELILSAVQDYIEAQDLKVADVCSEMREKSEKYQRHSSLWDGLAELLPHREKGSIYEHAKRKLMAGTRTGSFTSLEKARVLEMTAMHGNDWKRIATELGRMTGDIKDLHKILKSRKNTGQFTLQERARLITAVKKVTKSPSDFHSFEIPYDDVPWKRVARLMKDERLPLDYLRHWKVVRKTSWLGPDLVAGMVTSTQQRNDDRKIIAYIAEREPEHESEITWSEIDSTLLTRHAALSRWRILCKENLLNYHLDFCGSLQFLMKKLNILEGGVIVPEDTDVVDNSDVDDDGEESETEVLEHVKLETIAADNDDDYRLSGGVHAEKRKIAAVTTVIDLDDQSKSKKHKKNKKVKEDKKEKKDKKSKKSKKVKKEKN